MTIGAFTLRLSYNTASDNPKRFANKLKRIYLNYPLKRETNVPLPDEAFHYLFRVLRCRDKEKLIAFSGDGYDYYCELHQENKKSAQLIVCEQQNNNNESSLKTILIQGLSKNERMDTAIQKAVELGVSEIYPVRTDFCAVKLATERQAKKQQHWQAIITSACEQSGRAVIPTLHDLQPLSAVLQNLSAEIKIILHPYQEKPILVPSFWDNPAQSVAVMIGPEGGFSEQEVELAEQQGFIRRQLGRRILRTETATIAALTLIQNQWGDYHFKDNRLKNNQAN